MEFCDLEKKQANQKVYRHGSLLLQWDTWESIPPPVQNVFLDGWVVMEWEKADSFYHNFPTFLKVLCWKWLRVNGEVKYATI